jgi:hypothetical protein
VCCEGLQAVKKLRSLPWMALLVACAVTAPQWHAAAQTHAAGRAVRYTPNKPLVSVLRADDTVVTVVRDFEMPDLAVPRGYSFTAWKTMVFPFVAIVQIEGTTSHLTPRGDWIELRVFGTVQEVLKNSTGVAVDSQSPIQLVMSGGEIALKGKRVAAIFSGVRLPARGRRYLLFGSLRDDGSLYVPAYNVFEYAGGRLSTLVDANVGDPIHVAGDAAAVFQEIQANAHIRLPRKQ